jgi:hypothetical protein
VVVCCSIDGQALPQDASQPSSNEGLGCTMAGEIKLCDIVGQEGIEAL